MPIVGDKPETGVRIAVERSGEAGPPWTYEGSVQMPNASLLIRCVVGEDASVEAALVDDQDRSRPDAPALLEKARLIVRAAAKQAHVEGLPPPRRIVRWRGEK